MGRYYVMTAIPYVNGKPHVGHAEELVQADVLARHWRRTDEVRFQTGTDDNALKNVQGAEAEGISPQEYVEKVATRFASLREALELSFDDFVRTSSDPRHLAGVEKLWRACEEQGDLYRKRYAGLYCIGCERFYTPDELTPDGRCQEHGTIPELVEEENWFFRLSGYQDRLIELIESDRLLIEPASRKKEVLSFIRTGLEDFSVSRSTERARGWGIPVPGDPSQVIYVWFDALANYITGPGYGTDEKNFDHWWEGSDEIVHVIGKGIIRFHAVYWPAMLLSAGIRLPTTIFVHEYLTANGDKISKSAGNADDPSDLVAAYGTEALRWWLLSEVARSGDTDFTIGRMVARANEDLANNLGNLVNRAVSMVNKYRAGVVPALVADNPTAEDLRRVCAQARPSVDSALGDFDFRRAVEAVAAIGDAGNRYVTTVKPWELWKAESQGGTGREALDAVLSELIRTCREIGVQLEPFLPAAGQRILAQCDDSSGSLPEARPIFPRLELAAEI